MSTKTDWQIAADIEWRGWLDAVTPLGGTVVMTKAFSDSILAARSDGVRTEKVEILVSSLLAANNVTNVHQHLNATSYVLGASVATKTYVTGGVKVRFQEIDSDRFVVVTKITDRPRVRFQEDGGHFRVVSEPTGGVYWRVCDSRGFGVESTGRRAGARSRGAGPGTGPSS